MPIPASHPSSSLLARVQRWLGLDDADDDSECPCAVAARIERAGALARAKQKAEKDAAKLGNTPGALASAVDARLDSPVGDDASLASAYSSSEASSCSIAAARRVMATQRTAQLSQRSLPGASASSSASRADEGKIDRAATYAMGGFFHSGFLADTFVYLPEVWLGADGEH